MEPAAPTPGADPPDQPFVNQPIDVSSLPRLPDDRFEPLDPRFLRIRLTGDAIAAAVVVVVAGVLALALPGSSGPPRWLPVVVAAGLLALIGLTAWLQRLEVRHLGYLVRDEDISFRSGVISRSVVTVPFARIQHVSIDRGPLARAYGLATLQLRTAGSGGVTVPGMNHDTAQQLKALVADRAAAVADEELTPVPSAGPTPSLEAPPPVPGSVESRLAPPPPVAGSVESRLAPPSPVAGSGRSGPPPPPSERVEPDGRSSDDDSQPIPGAAAPDTGQAGEST